jgi:hypothetical protein
LQDALMEILFGATQIVPYLPSFYLLPLEALIQHKIFWSLILQLDMVKDVHSQDMLAYNGALLDATVARDTHRKGSAISRLLQTSPNNVIKGQKRMETLDSSGHSQFTF